MSFHKDYKELLCRERVSKNSLALSFRFLKETVTKIP